MNHNEKIIAVCKLLGKIVEEIIGLFLAAALVYLGYFGLSYLLSLPTIPYWMVFANAVISRILSIRTSFSNIERD